MAAEHEEGHPPLPCKFLQHVHRNAPHELVGNLETGCASSRMLSNRHLKLETTTTKKSYHNGWLAPLPNFSKLTNLTSLKQTSILSANTQSFCSLSAIHLVANPM